MGKSECLQKRKNNLLFHMLMYALLEPFTVFQVEATDHSNASPQRTRGVTSSSAMEKSCEAKLQSLAKNIIIIIIKTENVL